MARFTDRSLKALTLPEGRKDMLVFDDECRGLGLRITSSGTKSFLVQWTDPATKRKVREPLGAWGSITIEQARLAVRTRLGDVAKGIDPAAERRKAKAAAEAEKAEKALTLDKLIDQWGDLHLSSRRPRYAAEAKRALKFAFTDYLKRPAARLSRADVVSVLDEIAAEGKTATVAQTIAFGRACYAWAEKRGRVPSSPFHRLPIASATTERDRVLSPTEVAEIWEAAGALGYPFGPFYRLALLTLQRREEVAGMRWSELSKDGKTWTIPAARMKNSRAHDVHLPEAARTILAGIPRQVDDKGKPIDLVFTTTGKTPVSGYSRAKASLDAAIMKARAKAAKEASVEPEKVVPWRLHDFRRTGVSRLAALGFDSIVADKLLAHKPAKLKGVASVYQRHDFAEERRRALEAWAAEVTSKTSEVSNVIKLERVRE
ncbi:tyrosine-type recombinase/integrase [Enterovirga rhinocerotis]|uniref:Phage integrase family protein n=1 Tax=Enterovirga rhinocerotis TaxID=1339210 RepID=A0A4R7BNF0_9HYPH|nr:site-specific integrase [Enterovirga rhinocerotis]TDR87060.1 phage integrase family protein [Enterovirga rhinocerotis]